MKRKWHIPSTDQAAAHFVDQADLTQYDLRDMKPVRFEFAAKEGRVNMRLPSALLQAVKAAASKASMPYQRYIRQALEQAIGK